MSEHLPGRVPGPAAAATVTRPPTRGELAEPTRCALHLVFPRPLRRRFALDARELVLGRDPGAPGCTIDDATVSRRHATVTWDPARATHVFADRGSRNGSVVDGIAVTGEARPLVNGSLLRLGDTLLVYEQDSAEDDGAADSVALPGRAAGMIRLRAQLTRAAADMAGAGHAAPVLIIGETGTGKERVAQEVHRASGRPGRLVALNCAALSPQLIESQLFGHVKGAFTGATETQPGLFRAAQGGTLFLDEIGELAAELQPKLLRALQEREILPLGATQPVRVDARVVAATHRDLAEASGAGGGFRADLYARLSLWELRLPPLRDRRVDLLDWLERLQRAWAEPRGAARELFALDADAAEALLRFPWPLNLRGLERLVHELSSTPPTAVVRRAQLPAWLVRPAAAKAPAEAAAGSRPGIPSEAEFRSAFDELGGSVHALARRFGRDRRQIYRWMESHGLRERREDPAPPAGPKKPG